MPFLLQVAAIRLSKMNSCVRSRPQFLSLKKNICIYLYSRKNGKKNKEQKEESACEMYNFKKKLSESHPY